MSSFDDLCSHAYQMHALWPTCVASGVLQNPVTLHFEFQNLFQSEYF